MAKVGRTDRTYGWLRVNGASPRTRKSGRRGMRNTVGMRMRPVETMIRNSGWVIGVAHVR